MHENILLITCSIHYHLSFTIYHLPFTIYNYHYHCIINYIRVVGSNPIWDSDFFRVYVLPNIFS